jgi:hypothetical protein
MSNKQPTKKPLKKKGKMHEDISIQTDLSFDELVKAILVPDPSIIVPPPKKRKKKSGK